MRQLCLLQEAKRVSQAVINKSGCLQSNELNHFFQYIELLNADWAQLKPALENQDKRRKTSLVFCYFLKYWPLMYWISVHLSRYHHTQRITFVELVPVNYKTESLLKWAVFAFWPCHCPIFINFCIWPGLIWKSSTVLWTVKCKQDWKLKYANLKWHANLLA